MNNGFVAKCFADACEFGNDLSLITIAAPGGDIHADATHHVPPGFSASAQLFKPTDAALASCSASFHTPTDPNFFLGEELVCLGCNHGFLSQLVFFLNQILGKISRI